eukprot:7387872-Prymnesium_polylepis.1
MLRVTTFASPKSPDAHAMREPFLFSNAQRAAACANQLAALAQDLCLRLGRSGRSYAPCVPSASALSSTRRLGARPGPRRHRGFASE